MKVNLQYIDRYVHHRLFDPNKWSIKKEHSLGNVILVTLKIAAHYNRIIKHENIVREKKRSFFITLKPSFQVNDQNY